MRAKVGKHEVEGTPEEIARLIELVDADANRQVAKKGLVADADKGASPFVSEDFAFSVLTRRPLGESHTSMLNMLHSAGDEWTSAPDLQHNLNLSTREFAGVLGAFGKRLSNTEGAGSRPFFDQYWDQENGYNLYRLPPAVRAALVKADVVR